MQWRHILLVTLAAVIQAAVGRTCQTRQNYSFWRDFFHREHVISNGFVGPIQSCEIICLDDSRCAGFALVEGYQNCALYDKRAVQSGRQVIGQDSYLCGISGCTDTNGRPRKERESWSDGCNTCYCHAGRASCTEKLCLPECRSNSDCPFDQACSGGGCINPCAFTDCFGPGYACVAVNHQGKCVNRFPDRCQTNYDCPDDKECLSGQCQNPCARVRCGYGPCRVVNHRPQCPPSPNDNIVFEGANQGN